jgi:hypothetical protein
VNITDLIALVRAGLDAAGHTRVPVLPPGTTITALPCVAAGRAADQPGAGNRSLVKGYELVILVPRTGQVEQTQLSDDLEAVVLRSLLPSQVQFGDRFPAASTGGEGTGEPPALSRIIPVTFVADVDLC